MESTKKFICKYCGKECKNANSLRNHERLCNNNPNKQVTCFHTNNPQKLNAWNRGLSKDTDERMKHLGEAVSKSLLGRPGHSVSDTTRLKISNTMKKNHCGGIRKGSGRGKKGWYKNYYCDSTYELVYVIYNLDHNIKFSRCDSNMYYLYEYNNSIRRYYPDFQLADGSIVEIKGYHTDQVDAKIKSVVDRQIVVLYKNDLQYAFDYVQSHYSYKKLEDLYE